MYFPHPCSSTSHLTHELTSAERTLSASPGLTADKEVKQHSLRLGCSQPFGDSDVEITGPWYHGRTADFCLLVFLLMKYNTHAEKCTRGAVGFQHGQQEPCRGSTWVCLRALGRLPKAREAGGETWAVIGVYRQVRQVGEERVGIPRQKSFQPAFSRISITTPALPNQLLLITASHPSHRTYLRSQTSPSLNLPQAGFSPCLS